MGVGIGIVAFIVLGIIGMLMDSTNTPVSPTLAGNWVYTLLAPGVRIDGLVMISGPDNDLHVKTSANYMWPGPDGYPHQVSESIEYDGSLEGQRLVLECVGGFVQMAGYAPAAPPGIGTETILGVSPDRLTIQGQVRVGGFLGSLSMRKQ
jgi:hypothetical protein